MKFIFRLLTWLFLIHRFTTYPHADSRSSGHHKHLRAVNIFSQNEKSNILNVNKNRHTNKLVITYKNGTVITDELVNRVKKSSRAPTLLRKQHKNHQVNTATSASSLNPSFITIISIRTNCDEQTCFPPQGNLLIGRKKFLYASSTCGLMQPETFCVLGSSAESTVSAEWLHKNSKIPQEHVPILVENNIVKKSSCEVCDSRDPFDFARNAFSHRIENVVKYNEESSRIADQKWWQSANDLDNVYIQLDLEAEFILTRIFIKFKNYPPQVMVLEKSVNYGRSWQTLAYYARDCREAFPTVSTRLDDLFQMPICISRYSNFESRELVYRPLIYGRLNTDPYMLAKHSKVTNLRIKFKQLLKLGDQLLNGNERSWFSQYYYAINEIQMMGFCSCNGHASKCDRVRHIEYDRDAQNYIVDGRCDCKHNTAGLNCEECLSLYNDLPWQAGEFGRVNECKLCECNGHANSCRFDNNVYELSGRVSGGVCNNCTDNTEGIHCEKCKINYYHDKNVPFSHPLACRPCNCDIDGTIYREPICIGNRCECKINVDGLACDTCKNGYWNLTRQNPDGCTKCDCNLAGTMHNLGCYENTGKCFPCKANVIGTSCDRCEPFHYGHLTDPANDGCKPCLCRAGLSYSQECHETSGQCDCIPNAEGRICDRIAPGFFCARIDHITYEAETEASKESDNWQVIDGRYGRNFSDFENELSLMRQWTGLGYMKVYCGETIRFRFNHTFSSGIYDFVIRYDTRTEFYSVEEDWNVAVRISSLADDEEQMRSLNFNITYCKIFRSRRAQLLVNEFELKENSKYEVELTFDLNEEDEFQVSSKDYSKQNRRRSTYYSASQIPTILIDSLVTMPSLSKELAAKNFNFDQLYLCREDYMALPAQISHNCNDILCRFTSHTLGLLPCACNPIGSSNNTCNPMGGQCPCKPNVINRNCDKCRLHTWDFSQDGCRACNCNGYGSKNNNCDQSNGKCGCIDFVTGKDCDKCSPGFWNHPRCIKCQCNGYSNMCSQETGACFDCKGNTEGHYCEICKKGFYGSPVLGVPCKPCSCPGINGQNFASECSLDDQTGKQVCFCEPGYKGARCELCDAFYYGDPLRSGGLCRECECSGNVDLNDDRNCDSKTGECKNCLYNTDGTNCEKCKFGFFGNALLHQCHPCQCNPMGTVGNTDGNCDPFTGICECLPNVIGRKCDECKNEFWNLKSGTGCEECDCDLSGTYLNSSSCHETNGQCTCLSQRGGRTCEECPFGYWGSPKTGCKKCECIVESSQTAQCDRATGQCACLPGIAGYRCDACNRGTTGTAPNCQWCGECFNSWECTQNELKERLVKLEHDATNIYSMFTITNKTVLLDFNSQYNILQKKLDDIKLILIFNKTSKDTRNLLTLRQRLHDIGRNINRVNENVAKKMIIIDRAKSNGKLLIGLRSNFTLLNTNSDYLLKQACLLKESYINGAQTSLINSKNISDKAMNKLNEVSDFYKTELNKTLVTLELKLSQLEPSIRENTINFTKLSVEVEGQDYSNKLFETENSITELNSIVCGSQLTNCSIDCGFKICKKCSYFNTTFDADVLDKYQNDSLISPECPESLGTSFMKMLSLNNTFKIVHKANEDSLKKYLTKATQSKLMYKKSYEVAFSLNNSLTNKIAALDFQSTVVTKLIEEIENLTQAYHTNMVAIKSNYELINEKSIDYSSEEFYMKLDLIKSLEPKSLSMIAALSSDVDKRREQLAEITAEYENFKTVGEVFDHDVMMPIANDTEARKIQLDSAITSLKIIVLENNDIEKIQFDIGLSLGNINANISQIEEKNKMINEAIAIEVNKNLVNAEKDTFLDVEAYKYKVIEIKQHSQLVIEKLNTMQEYVEKIMLNLRQTGDFREIASFLLILELQEKIAHKRDEISGTYERIKDYELRYKMVTNELKSFKSELNELTQKTKRLKFELSKKSNFTQNCH